MHITLETDYVIRIVVFLARENRRVDANTISQNTGVTLRFSLKILRNLVANGITKSYKGTLGGYELNKAPEDITLCELVEAVEGPYKFSRCIDEDNKCTNPACDGTPCKVNRIFCDITEKVREMMNTVTVRDLM